jgi:spoIIIJ-associated protein
MPAQPKEILEKILALLDFPATVHEHKLDDGLLLDIQMEDSGRLIGRQGQTLSNLEYIINRILFQQDATSPKVMVDVGGYRSQTREALIKKAKYAADKVRHWGEPVELEPMGSFDRHIIHNAFKDDPDVETHSVELDGTDKKVILLRPRH